MRAPTPWLVRGLVRGALRTAQAVCSNRQPSELTARSRVVNTSTAKLHAKVKQ